ncbi:MAG: thiolase domain-containing protein [Candidatus Aenigmarchaeota archaeon]|nr:thiolase domain-containing protein [Candidatus Aenigmarchaeota archaeon]
MMKVGVIGVGQTKFGEHWDKSLKNLIQEAGLAAVNDSGMDKERIDGIFVGNMAAGTFSSQEHLGALTADWLGLTGRPAVRCESACSSGANAFRQAYMAVKSGEHEAAIVVGVEKMTDVRTDSALTSLMGAGDAEWETPIGLTFTGLYALMARAHMNLFNTTREQMALVSVTNHRHGLKNPYAQFRKEITVGDVLQSSMIADPLGVLDCSPLTDGAASVIIASESFIKNNGFAKEPVWILGSHAATDTIAFHDRHSLTEMRSVKLAAKNALEKSGTSLNKINLLEVHDCFSINEIVCLEDTGFCEKGKGGRMVERQEITKDGSIPTNIEGGLKSIGHPVGATGVRQIVDITRQLREEGFNQVNGAERAMAVNVGGIGASAVAHVLSKNL